MIDDVSDGGGQLASAGKPVIVFYELNPVAMLDLELSLRELLGERALLRPLARLAELNDLAANPNVVLFLLDGKLGTPAYTPLATQDPRVFYLKDCPGPGKAELDRRPSAFALRQLPPLARLLAVP